jgi:hypothetical protein
MKPEEPAACNLTHEIESTQSPSPVSWPSLVPSSPKAQFDVLIGRKGNNELLKKVAKLPRRA